MASLCHWTRGAAGSFARTLVFRGLLRPKRTAEPRTSSQLLVQSAYPLPTSSPSLRPRLRDQCSALGRTPCTWVYTLRCGLPPSCTAAYTLHCGLPPSCTAAYPPIPILWLTPSCPAMRFIFLVDQVQGVRPNVLFHFIFAIRCFLPKFRGYAPMDFLFVFCALYHFLVLRWEYATGGYSWVYVGRYL